jgi:hypothetical protein
MTDEHKPTPVPVKPVVTGSWKEMLARWLFDQSVSTVLLISILAVTVYGVPKVVLPSVKDGYKENAESFERIMKIYVDANERQVKLIMDGHDRDRDTFEKSMRIHSKGP